MATDYVEYAIYGPPGELPDLPDLQAAAGAGLVEIETTEIPDDWADRWRDFHEPVVVGGGRLVVRPSWEGDAGAAAEVDIVVDPGRAFGTGAHATTRSCLELLLDARRPWARRAGALADWGTGSGGPGDRRGQARLATRRRVRSRAAGGRGGAANAESNDVDGRVERINLREETPPEAPTVVANLTAPLLLPLAARMRRRARSPRRTGWSSAVCCARERDGVAGAYAAAGLEVAGEISDGRMGGAFARTRSA